MCNKNSLFTYMEHAPLNSGWAGGKASATHAPVHVPKSSRGQKRGEGQHSSIDPRGPEIQALRVVHLGGNLPGPLTLTLTRASALSLTQYPDPVLLRKELRRPKRD